MRSFESIPENEHIPEEAPEPNGLGFLARKAKQLANIALAGLALSGSPAQASEKAPERAAEPEAARYAVQHIEGERYTVTDSQTRRTIPFSHFSAPETEIKAF